MASFTLLLVGCVVAPERVASTIPMIESSPTGATARIKSALSADQLRLGAKVTIDAVQLLVRRSYISAQNNTCYLLTPTNEKRAEKRVCIDGQMVFVLPPLIESPTGEMSTL